MYYCVCVGDNAVMQSWKEKDLKLRIVVHGLWMEKGLSCDLTPKKNYRAGGKESFIHLQRELKKKTHLFI